jgi:formate C-acetyltransferase
MLRSAAALPQELAGGGAILNLKLDPTCLATPRGCQAAISLVRGYFALGGHQVQTTLVAADDLVAATRDPERWGHLIVRVGGFSARFTSLAPDLQQAIIARTQVRTEDLGLVQK